MSTPPVSAVTDGGSTGPTSTASATRKDDANENKRPVRLGNNNRLDARACAKLKELNKIKDLDDTLLHLVRKGYSTEDTVWEPRLITAAIMQLTASATTEEAGILKALGLILERVDFEVQAQLLTGALMQELEDPIADLREMRNATRQAEAVVEDIEDEVQRLKAATEDMRAEMEEARNTDTDTLSQIQQAIQRLEEAVKTPPPRPRAATGQLRDRLDLPRAHSPASTNYDGQFPPLPDLPPSQ